MTFAYQVYTNAGCSRSRYIVPVDIDATDAEDAARQRIALLDDGNRGYDSGTALVTSDHGDARLFNWTRERNPTITVTPVG